MFCPRCGKAEQIPESYCRQCGLYLPDLSKPVKRESPPEEHLKANTVLSVMTIVTSFTLSILLWAFFGARGDTHPLIYVTAGPVARDGRVAHPDADQDAATQEAMAAQKSRAELEPPLPEPASPFKSAATAELLNEANFADAVPASVTENITRHLAKTPQQKIS